MAHNLLWELNVAHKGVRVIVSEESKTYERTHKWLKFDLDLRSAPTSLWMTLGEIRSKCEHIAGVPLDKETADKLYALYLTRGVQATTAIEGNTLTEEQVRKRIEGDLALPQSMAYQGQEVDNIVLACNTILKSLTEEQPVTLDAGLIKGFNKIVLAALPLRENVVPGEIRKIPVTVGSYRGAPAEDCEYLLERMCTFLTAELERRLDLDPISKAVLLAIWAHLYLAWIHPFGDGNGRTARLVEFMLLLEGGVPAPAAHLLSNHYNQTRQNYYLELDKASRSGGDIVSFFNYALTGFVDGLKGQLKHIQRLQHSMIWRDYVREVLQVKSARESARVLLRRQHLVLALSDEEKSIPAARLSELSPALAKAYATKTKKTLSRDINALKELGLVEEDGEGFRARVETILAFLPPKRDSVPT
jgi:Fic family protein